MILVVEDEAALRELLEDILVEEGYEVLLAETGREGVRLFRENGGAEGKISLVLLDMVLPDTTGAEVFAELRQINPRARVLLSSGYSDAEAARELSVAGAVGFMAKPYRAGELAKRIAELLKKDE